MTSFTDNASRVWTLQLNVAAMRRAKKLDIDLSMPIGQLREFVLDDVFLSDALWALIGPEAEKQGVSQEQFDAAMNGKTFEAARAALWSAMEEYFDPGKSEMLMAAVRAIKEELGNVTTSLGSGDVKANLGET